MVEELHAYHTCPSPSPLLSRWLVYPTHCVSALSASILTPFCLFPWAVPLPHLLLYSRWHSHNIAMHLDAGQTDHLMCFTCMSAACLFVSSLLAMISSTSEAGLSATERLLTGIFRNTHIHLVGICSPQTTISLPMGL